MPKPDNRPFVLVYANRKFNEGESFYMLCHEIIANEIEAKERFAELAKETNGDVLVFRDTPTPAEIDTAPRVTFGVPQPPLDTKPKTKRTRRTKAEMEAARAAGEEKPKKATNGAVTA